MLGLWSRHTVEPDATAPVGGGEIAFPVDDDAAGDDILVNFADAGVGLHPNADLPRRAKCYNRRSRCPRAWRARTVRCRPGWARRLATQAPRHIARDWYLPTPFNVVRTISSGAASLDGAVISMFMAKNTTSGRRSTQPTHQPIPGGHMHGPAGLGADRAVARVASTTMMSLTTRQGAAGEGQVVAIEAE